MKIDKHFCDSNFNLVHILYFYASFMLSYAIPYTSIVNKCADPYLVALVIMDE